MFERFAGEAREAVTVAHDAARDSGASTVTSAHLLSALMAPDSLAARAMLAAGTDPAEVARAALATDDGLDAQALAAIGIDLDAVRTQVEARFGDGALDRRGARGGRRLPFAADAKKVLELSLREAIAANHRRIDSGHVLLALTRLERRTPAAQVLAADDVDVTALRAAVVRCRAERPAA